MISLVLVLSMICTGSVFAKDKQKDLKDDIRTFILEQMEIIKSTSDDCTWTEETVIDNISETYDLDNKINSYIFEFTTLSEVTGYIQVDVSTDTPTIQRYNFGDRHPIRNMVTSAKEKLKNKYKQYEDRIIYTGGYNYYIENKGTKELFKVDSLSVEQKETSVLKEEYGKSVLAKINYQGKSVQSNVMSRSISTPIIVTVPSISSFSPVIMDDYPNYTNHCVPTAGVNIVKYWANCRGKTQLYTGYMQAFTSMYSKMQTKSSGTEPYNGYLGLYNYGVSWGLTPTSREFRERANYIVYPDIQSAPLWTRVTRIIDAGVPFIYEFAGHANVCVGYKTLYGPDYLILINGWSRSLTYEIHGDGYLSVACFHDHYYSRWN